MTKLKRPTLSDRPGFKAKPANKKLKESSRIYMTRQLNDPFVQAAHAHGYRARAYFKLEAILAKYPLLTPQTNGGEPIIIDLGCAPGSWSQCIQVTTPRAKIIGIDLLETEPLEGCIFLEADFTAEAGLASLLAHIPATESNPHKLADIVMSDMAANTIGHKETDGLRTQALVELAAEFAIAHLKLGGHFITKFFQHGGEKDFQLRLQKHFRKVSFYKPPASRKDSRETFLIAQDFLG
jgi:23S rRNA (uridine2552-2'-O)-methyltransferase